MVRKAFLVKNNAIMTQYYFDAADKGDTRGNMADAVSLTDPFHNVLLTEKKRLARK